ncbi:hypothetical protein CR970_01500 [Candidatus Saccharibacteria bacterium]|nr:MAG: hypothetical protein CR970_01500 [Candidatus Saccharibacteria bacterium]
MNHSESYQAVQQAVHDAQRIVIIQADNPDIDSLGSALALEQILGEAGKDVYLCCHVQIPQYLHYVAGWDRVYGDLPSQFDLSIIVDTSSMTLLSKVQDDPNYAQLTKRPCIILDHHASSDDSIPFATTTINDPGMSSTGELVYSIARTLDWPLDTTAGACIMAAILGDTQGLTNDLATPTTYRIMAELLDMGVSRQELEEKRRESGKMHPDIFRYKAALIERTQLVADGRLAIVSVPQSEINTYSPLYNPAPLITTDMLQTQGVLAAIVVKHYDDGKVLASIRCNHGAAIASTLAERFGGGGHPYAAGFKLTDGRPVDEIMTACISYATELLDSQDMEEDD